MKRRFARTRGVARQLSLLGASGLVFLFLFLVGCGSDAPVDTGPVTRPVKVQELKAGGLDRVVDFPGQILAARRADLAFEVSGLMQEILVNEGFLVAEGQELAKLDPRDFQARKDAAEARRDVAQLDAQRAQELFSRDAISEQRLDLAKTDALVAEAEFEQAAKALSDTVLRAPFAGRVARVFVEDFVNVQAKQTILIIQDTSSLRVEVEIPETIPAGSDPNANLAEISERVNPQVYLTARPDRFFPGVLTEVAGLADEQTRTFTSTVSFSQPEDLTILPGMTANVRVTIPSAPGAGYSVPSHAVVATDSENPFVWLVDGATMTVSRSPVTLGDYRGDLVEVSGSALTEGALVATSGVQFLHDGATITRYGE